MGTINYKRNDIITLGLNTDNYDSDLDEWEKNEIVSDEYNEAKRIIDDYGFDWFNVELIYGYYEGFYLDIERLYLVSGIKNLENEELDEIKEDIKKLYELLDRLVEDTGMYVCYPHWCTGWEGYKGSKEKIKEAINKLKEEINAR